MVEAGEVIVVSPPGAVNVETWTSVDVSVTFLEQKGQQITVGPAMVEKDVSVTCVLRD
jgi:hypothetical protein